MSVALPSHELDAWGRNQASPCAAFYLQPGRLFAAAAPTLVTTILGSCVAVCLFDATRGVGGMNHFLLPHWVTGSEESPRYGAVATRRLVDRVLELGCRKQSLRAKVFGGAHMFGGTSARGGELGGRNVALAFELLAEHRVPVIASDVGGPLSRKLVFRTDDGAAWVRKL